MKSKLLLPVVALVFAVASAFATESATQMGWFHVSPNSAIQGQIDQSQQTCTVGGAVQCTINGQAAYESELDAKNQNANRLLKYNP